MFIRKVKSNLSPAGSIAGYIDVNGYRCIQTCGRPYKAHRLAWFYVTGFMPSASQCIDHVNGKKADNRFANLRLATNSQNQANRGAPKNSTTGIKGVSWQPDRGKWYAKIMIDGRFKNLGRYATKEGAQAAYEIAAKERFGNFAYGSDIQLLKVEPVGREGFIQHAELTQSDVQAMFDYDPETGWLTRRVSRQGQAKAGDRAGNVEWTGHRRVKIQGRSYREHHIIWLYVTGLMPKEEIDHINGNPGDNRIANLRECGRVQNLHNRRVQTRAVTGLKGVSYDARCVRKYNARIKIGEDRVDLGWFMTPEEASEAYNKAAIEAFGSFAVANRSVA